MYDIKCNKNFKLINVIFPVHIYIYLYFIFFYISHYYILTGNICGVRFTIILNRVTSSVVTLMAISSADITFVTKSSIMEFVIHPKM